MVLGFGVRFGVRVGARVGVRVGVRVGARAKARVTCSVDSGFLAQLVEKQHLVRVRVRLRRSP